ncbi:hypothetical protein J437_LFUL001795 [Ladona fulva]|uniref:Glucose-methanol-choline oxidoreductase C-terminal domain-containing protein n=1 Tax=Ladona fulva TaxID=123851 RepID=A0A8K0JWS6_LADFU|nr:hypothetical protein J437_LFUL001795 [Ladona fulva]
MVVLATCLQPKSRGYVELASVFSRKHPFIDPNYLSRKEDVACTAQAYRLAVKVVRTKPFRELGAKVHLPKFRQCWHLPVDLESDEYMECIIRTAAITGYHPGGTCSMGNSSFSVVDSNLR